MSAKTRLTVRLTGYELSRLTNRHSCEIVARENEGGQYVYWVRLGKAGDLDDCGLPVGAVKAILADAK